MQFGTVLACALGMADPSDTPHAPKGQASSSDVNGVDAKDQIPGGRYHIVERLSTGTIGAVYKALDTILERPVAIKCVRLDTPGADRTPDEVRERFVREARIVARLQHPNIVTIHDIVATPDRGFIIMEFIEGRTLESLSESEGRVPLSTAIQIMTQLGSALDYAHERNVVHRDVKPSNILVSSSLNVWVADFGIAKSELSTNLTMAGGVLGAPDYMSPEQAKGEDVDARSDLFSLGCILFELVAGEKPFRSPSLTGILLSIINDEPVFPLNWQSLGLPMELKPILHHALEKERDKRFGSGAELVEALEKLTRKTKGDADAVASSEDGALEPAEPEKAAVSGESPRGPPEWKTEQPYRTVLEGDMEALAELGRHGLAELVMTTHAGMTTEEFKTIVTDWISTARHPTTRRLFSEMIFQPMLELLDYLRANGFKTYIVSGGGIEFMRPWTERVYGIPPEQVVGSSIKTKFEIRDGRPVLVRLPELNFVDDKEGKPVGINSHIGRRPIAAFGNSDGDLQMLQWTAAGHGARLVLYVHHTDAEREWAYDRTSPVGQLDNGLDEASDRGWTVVDMKEDWKNVYPEP